MGLKYGAAHLRRLMERAGDVFAVLPLAATFQVRLHGSR